MDSDCDGFNPAVFAVFIVDALAYLNSAILESATMPPQQVSDRKSTGLCRLVTNGYRSRKSSSTGSISCDLSRTCKVECGRVPASY